MRYATKEAIIAVTVFIAMILVSALLPPARAAEPVAEAARAAPGASALFSTRVRTSSATTIQQILLSTCFDYADLPGTCNPAAGPVVHAPPIVATIERGLPGTIGSGTGAATNFGWSTSSYGTPAPMLRAAMSNDGQTMTLYGDWRCRATREHRTICLLRTAGLKLDKTLSLRSGGR